MPTKAKPIKHKLPKQTKKARKRNFLNNADLLEETIKSQEQGRMTEKLGILLMTLTKRYKASSRGNFSRYTFFEDMQSEALVNLCKAYKKFDASRFTNAFAFYTSCVHNSYIQMLKKENRERLAKDSLLVKAGMNPSFKFIEQHQEKMKKEADDNTIPTSDDVVDVVVDSDSLYD